MVGSIVGGRVTDKLSHKYKCTEGGLLASIIGILAMQPGLLVKNNKYLFFLIFKGVWMGIAISSTHCSFACFFDF